MRAGDKLRFRGPAGAPFMVTVGIAVSERTIRARVKAGEWTPLPEAEAKAEPDAKTESDADAETGKDTGSKADTEPEPEPDAAPGGPPAQSAPKGEWVAYAVQRGMGSADAEATSKADLIAAYKE